MKDLERARELTRRESGDTFLNGCRILGVEVGCFFDKK